MAERRRVIRCAQIEYQPNLQYAAEPIPLGVVVEERNGDVRTIVLIGGTPRSAQEALDSAGAWGPFRDMVTNWFEGVTRSIQLLKKADPSASVLDGLAQQWHSNVYLTAPEPVKERGKLEELADICFKRHTKDTEPMRVDTVRFDERELVTA